MTETDFLDDEFLIPVRLDGSMGEFVTDTEGDYPDVYLYVSPWVGANGARVCQFVSLDGEEERGFLGLFPDQFSNAPVTYAVIGDIQSTIAAL